MGEGILSGVLGEEEGRPEIEAPAALASAEAFAAAVAAKLSGNDPAVARKTVDFLTEQTELLKVQKEHLKDEHAARLHYLHGQAREVDIRRVGLRLRVGFQVFLTLVSVAVGILVLLMIFDAVNSRSVVIEPFDTEPNVAAEAPNGKIVAEELLDVLTTIQASIQISAEKRALANAWTNEIEIEIPEAGVSLGQLERVLKARLGHDLHIGGELVRTENGGLAITVRGTGILPQTFADESRNVGKLMTAAGEYLYGQSQPRLWASYLNTHNRTEEAIRFCKAASATAGPDLRPYLLNIWGSALAHRGDEAAFREALPLFREALRQKADHWNAYTSLADAEENLGDEEGAVATAEQMRKAAGGRPGRAPEISYRLYDSLRRDQLTHRAAEIADMEVHGGIGGAGSSLTERNLNIALIDIQLHDDVAAEVQLRLAVDDQMSASAVTMVSVVRALLAEEHEDGPAAAREWDLVMAAYADPKVRPRQSSLICSAAPTYETLGLAAKADAALNALGKLSFVDCYRFKGDVLDRRGDWVGAKEWYARAVKLAPSIPSSYYSWGLALMRHGDLVGAEAKFKDANRYGPHWADPLKAWGDVLEQQRDVKQAIAKYDEALKYAPNWKQLKGARQAVSI